MTLNDYQEKCLRTSPAMTVQELVNYTMLGLAGETGEVVDAYKKFQYHGHSEDKSKMIEELGDVLWYVSIMLYAMGYTLEDCARINIEKLIKRYPNGFEKERSINRDEYEK